MNDRARTAISLGAVLALVLMLVGVGWSIIGRGTTSGAPDSDAPASAPTTTVEVPDVTDRTLAGFQSQTVDWHPCTADGITPKNVAPPRSLDGYECGSVRAPLDWNDLEGDTLVLALAVHRSGKQGAPALFYNPGGPGGSAVNMLGYQVESNLGKDLVNTYDIVALDPRGVGASTPVVCMTDEERDAYLADQYSGEEQTDAHATVKGLLAASEQFLDGCENHSKGLVRHLGTPSVARDFDMVRAILGQEKLNYLGYSYGTFIGAVYADLFPTKVGRFVLDGAIDPSSDVDAISALQMQGFEDALTHWIEDCQAGSGCPLTGDAEAGARQLRNFLDSLAASPLPTSDEQRPLTQSLALSGILGMLYSTQTYGMLTQGLKQAMGSHDGSILLAFADYMNEREADGTYSSNGVDALAAVNMADYPPKGDEEEWIAQAKDLEARLPILGEFAGYASASVSVWPWEREWRAHRVRATGSGPILVVGTRHDPATPWVMAQSLADQLDEGVLLTWEGWDHTAYSRTGDSCVADAVDTFLTEGTAPADGTVCGG